MPTKSRVNQWLPPVSAQEAYAFRVQAGKTSHAIVGDGYGNTSVAANANRNNYGLVWVRDHYGVDGNQQIKTGKPYRARIAGDFYPVENVPVNVRINAATGHKEIVGNDNIRLAQQGVNPNGFNQQDPRLHNIWLEDIRNMRGFIPTTNATSSTKLSVEPYIFIYNDEVKFAQKGQTDNIDLSSYVPTAGNERLVGTALKASDNTVQIVSGTTRTIAALNTWALSDLQELYDSLDSDAMPMDIWRLADAQTEITQTDRLFDWRQVVNLPSGAGGGNVIAKTNTIPSGKDAFFAGGLTITGGLTVSGEMYILP